MNNAYQSLMRAAQPQQPKARPVHHIIEEKADPVTGEKQLSGSSWREDASNQQNDFYRLSGDPKVNHKDRSRYYDLANQLEVDIAQEDAIHKDLEEKTALFPGDRAMARTQAARPRIHEGLNPETGTGPGIPRSEAAKRGWTPPR
jgi:hypothetical protein